VAYRSFYGICLSTIIVSACSGDESAPAVTTPDGGSTGGSVTGTGGRSSGGSNNTGGAATGGRSGGGTSGAGGASTGGGGTGNGGASGASTGGGGTGNGGAGGTAGAGATGTGGASTGGAATDGGGACGALSGCCSSLTGGQRTVCENIVNAGVGANCTAVSDVFCGDGGVVGPPGGGRGDAFVDCSALATCCAALADGGRAARQCDRLVTNGSDAVCNQVSALFCN
jgi:hypothetical protein